MTDQDPFDRLITAINDARHRIEEKAEQLKAARRRNLANEFAAEHGPGPWLLHDDGRVTPAVTLWDTPASGPSRILWNQRGGDIDEVVITDCAVHVEQMDNRTWWIGIDRVDGAHWAGNFHADSRGRMTFTEQENDGLAWDQDDSHQDI